jgi:hypothetical protein
VHQAVPVGSAPSHSNDGYRSRGYRDAYRYGYGYRAWHPGWYAWGFGYTPVWYGGSEVQPTYSGDQGQPAMVSTLAFQGQAMLDSPSTPGGGALAFFYAVEGPQVGLLLDSNSMFLRADDGSLDTDALHLIDAHVTYALVSSPHGRLRLEAGLDSAIAPDIAFFGPGGGVSGVIGLFGSTSLEGSLRVTAYPFTKVDWSAGLNIGMGTVALRMGWRQTYLDDQGRVDGVSHEDLLYGPYLGLALAL